VVRRLEVAWPDGCGMFPVDSQAFTKAPPSLHYNPYQQSQSIHTYLEDEMNALRLFPKMVIIVGIAFALAGLVVAGAGVYIRNFVVQQLTAQQITTPEDASLPN